MERIYIPYRERAGRIKWPGDARVAIAVYLGVEEWGHETMVKYNGVPPLAPRLYPGQTEPDLGITTVMEYGYRVGIYRLVDIFDELGLKVSLLTSGMVAERHPELLKTLAAQGYEVIAHAYDQSRYLVHLDRSEQREDIENTVTLLEKATGVRPEGWGSPGTRQTEETMELLAEAGFLYHMGLHDDELPYLIRIGQRTLIEIPYRIGGDSGDPNDMFMYSEIAPRVGSEAFEYMKIYFDARYEEGAKIPQFFTISAHPFVSGRPDRAKILRQFLRYVRGFPDVWIARVGDVAKWWRDNRFEMSRQAN